MKSLFKAVLVMVLLVTAACASSAREPVRSYDRARVGEVNRMENAEIVSLTPVEIEGNESRIGTVLGAVAGGLAGRQVGSGSGRDIMTVIGAVAGGYAGSQYRDGEARAEGVRIGLEMDNGERISIIQELDENETFRVGEDVTVVFNGDKARVEH